MIEFKYRPDVDGLRAVAVLMVLFFHAHLGFTGGFIGVDVFFVISGFLITGLILKGQQNRNFTLSNFWARRIRRIIPAASAVVIATLIAGFFLLLPWDFEKLAESALAQQLMLANIYFWMDTDYFAGPSELKPLLHMWSLAVEEQFYLVYPLLLILCRRMSTRMTRMILAVLALISLIASEWVVRTQPSAAFFLVPTRAWELLLGGLIAFYPKPQSKLITLEILSWTGMGMILLASWMFDSSTRFPGAYALIPCLGTSLIIYANGGHKTSLAKVLSHRCFVFIGLISYSLYLWHWPLLAFLRYWLGDNPTMQIRFFTLAASIFVAWLSWRFIEIPFRNGFQKFKTKDVVSVAVASSIVLVGISFWINQEHGLPERLPTNLTIFTEGNKVPKKWSGDSVENLPILGTRKGQPDFLVWGDSHAMSLGSLFDELAIDLNLSGIIAARHGTVPLIGVARQTDRGLRLAWNNDVINYVNRKNVKHVFLVGRWAVNVEGKPGGDLSLVLANPKSKLSKQSAQTLLEKGLKQTLAELIKNDVKVTIVRQVPLQSLYPERELVRAALLGNPIPYGVSLEDHQLRQRNANHAIDEVVREFPSVEIIDPTESSFNKFGTSLIGNEFGSFYADDNHLSPLGARTLLKSLFEASLRKVNSS